MQQLPGSSAARALSRNRAAQLAIETYNVSSSHIHRGSRGAEHSRLVCTGVAGSMLPNQFQTKSLKIHTNGKPNKLDFKPICPFSKLMSKPIPNQFSLILPNIQTKCKLFSSILNYHPYTAQTNFVLRTN